jgi:hypothetical protein
MAVGLNEAGWGVPGAQDIASAFQSDRLDTSTGEPPSDFYNNGVKVDILMRGTCATCGYGSGVSSINAGSWASSALSYYQSNCPGGVSQCPTLEVLNEPAGSWFWGSDALSSGNEAAYDSLLQTTYTTFHNQYGSASPKILGSYDGGYAGGSSWGPGLYAQNPSIGNYVDGWTVHPYGGCGYASSAQGSQGNVTGAHAATGKPIYVTEVGWPTAVGQTCTGDSQQWTEAQQAGNIYKFVTWARSTGYVGAVYYFNYRDYGTNMWYGLERWNEGNGSANGSKKPGWTALQQASAGQACTVCS